MTMIQGKHEIQSINNTNVTHKANYTDTPTEYVVGEITIFCRLLHKMGVEQAGRQAGLPLCRDK